MIYKVLIVFVLVLYGNWIFLMFYYPLMVLGAIGSKEKSRKKAYLLCFPLRVTEHLLRFGRGDLHYSKSPKYHHAISENYSIKDWV